MDAYLYEIKTIIDSLVDVNIPIPSFDLVYYTLLGLGREYESLVITLTHVPMYLTFDDLHPRLRPWKTLTSLRFPILCLLLPLVVWVLHLRVHHRNVQIKVIIIIMGAVIRGTIFSRITIIIEMEGMVMGGTITTRIQPHHKIFSLLTHLEVWLQVCSLVN